MGLLGLAGSLLGMIPKVGSPSGKKKGKSGGSKGKSAKKSSKKKSSTKKKQRKSNKKKKKKKRKKKKKKWGKFFTKARKLKNSLSKSKLVKRAKKAIKKAVLTTKKVVKKTKAAVSKAKQQVKTAVKQTKQVVKEKVLPVVKKAAQATKKSTNNSSTKAKTSSVDKNRITSEAELKALLDEHRKTRVIGSDGEPITTLTDKRKVLSAESTVTPDGLFPYVMLGSKMSYSMFIEDYLKLSDAKAPIKENFDAALSLINPVRKVKKGEEALETVRNMEKVIEETYDFANNSKKAKDAKSTQKEIDQLGEYVKKVDKGTGKVISEVSELGSNKIHHILQDKHAWGKVVTDKNNWDEVSKVISNVMENGTEGPYKKSALMKSMSVNGQIVEVTFVKLPNGTIKISDAWVKTK